MDGIYFPGAGINFENIPSGFAIFGFEIKIYGLIITVGFIIAYLISVKEAKRTGQKDEDYLDLLLCLVIPSILGARIYYIIFNLKEFVTEGQSFGTAIIKMLNIRNGGLAIYGGLIAGLITIIIFSKKKGIKFTLVLDTIVMGILLGQILGRWGNFFNREAFGDYTSAFTRMAIPIDYYSSSFFSYLEGSGIVTEEMLSHQEVVNGISCITVHPTFLYESLWNLLLLIIIFVYRKHKRFDGELITIYALGYGIGRFIIEGLRADSLMIGSLRISQVVAMLCIIMAVCVISYNTRRQKKISSTSRNVEESGE